MPLKVVPSTGPGRRSWQSADTARGQGLCWLGFRVGVGPDGEPDLRISGAAWDRLDALLAEANGEPDPAASAAAIAGWVQYLGPCRPTSDPGFSPRLRRVLAGHGFQEAYDRDRVERWAEAGATHFRTLVRRTRTDTPAR